MSTSLQNAPYHHGDLRNALLEAAMRILEREGEAELFFVPIRPGAYDWGCAGLEEKGMAGKFIVK